MLEIAISPCPNDTFLFHAWIKGLVGTDFPVHATFADIEQLNCWGLEKKFPLIKVSIANFANMQEDYELLTVGCALGHNCGPKLIARKKISLEDLSNMRVAIPGRETTAHALLNLLCPQPRQKHFCLYHEIEQALTDGTVDAGLIIHETRFTHGFYEIADLGELWHTRFQLPIPLGGIAAHKSLPTTKLSEILRDSLRYARRYPDKSTSFILHHAQNKNPAVIRQHIDLYVNDETLALSAQGKAAIELILNQTTSLHHLP